LLDNGPPGSRWGEDEPEPAGLLSAKEAGPGCPGCCCPGAAAEEFAGGLDASLMVSRWDVVWRVLVSVGPLARRPLIRAAELPEAPGGWKAVRRPFAVKPRPASW